VGYGSLDRKTNGYGSLDRHTQKQQVPQSPETDIKQPFYPIKPQQASYQQSSRPLEPPRGQYEESVSPDRYREPREQTNSYREPVQSGYHEPPRSKQTEPDLINRSPSPKDFQKYPSSYRQSPHNSKTESPRGYSSDVPRDPHQANRKEYGQPYSGMTKGTDSGRSQQPGYQKYDDRYQPRDKVEPSYHQERRHSEDSPFTGHQGQVSVNNNSSSSGREPDSPQLRRSATLPVGRTSNKVG
jgi:hypothetical protein